MLRRILVLIVVLVVVLVPTTATAISNPTSLTILDAVVFRNVVETGDDLWFVRYNLNYAVVPSEPVSSYFNMSLYTAAGVYTGYTRPLNYYQENIISIYLTPTQALSLTWGAANIVKVLGNPAVFVPTQEGVNLATAVMGAGSYHEAADLGAYMINTAKILQTDWAITLLTSDQLYLNTTGTTYFSAAVPGLQSMVPTIFQTSVVQPPFVAQNYTSRVGADEWKSHSGARLNGAVANIASIFSNSSGASTQMGIFLVVMLSVVLGSIGYAAAPSTPVLSLMLALLGLPIGAWIGLIDLTLLLIVLVTLALIFGVTFIIGRFS